MIITDPTLGRKLRVLRILRGQKLSDVQRSTGLPSSYISRIETGYQNPTEQQVDLLKQALGWTPEIEEALALLVEEDGKESADAA